MDKLPMFCKVVEKFDQMIKFMDLDKYVEGSHLEDQARILCEACSNRLTLGPAQVNAEWSSKQMEIYQAYITLERFVEVVEPFKLQPSLKKKLKTVLSGSITQDFKPSPAKDVFYELEVAAALRYAGFDVRLEEPDLVVRDNGLSQPVALACKYPSSRQQLNDHVSNGYRQISKHGINDAVCIGLDLLVGPLVAKVAQLSGRIDFRSGDRPALEDHFHRLDREVNALIESRPKEYPSEQPINGLMMTLFIVGIDSDPPRPKNLQISAIGCLKENVLKQEMDIIAEGINAIETLSKSGKSSSP